MADTGNMYPLTIAFSDFTNPSNMLGQPDVLYSIGGGFSTTALQFQLYYNGSPIGNYKQGVSPQQNVATIDSFGGSSDLWGATLNPNIINSSTFGIRGWYLTIVGQVDRFFCVTDYSFDIPSDATINGVQVELLEYYTMVKTAVNLLIDSVAIKIYYTEASSGTTHEGEVSLSSFSYLRTKKA